MADNFRARLAQSNLVNKNDFVKKTDFDDNLNNLNKKVLSNKSRHIEVKTKLNNSRKKVNIISTKKTNSRFDK